MILCITLTSCSKTVNEDYKSPSNMVNNILSTMESTKNEQDYNKLFELNLYSDKQIYKTTDKIKVSANLKYIGDDSQVKIWHGDPYISFSITD